MSKLLLPFFILMTLNAHADDIIFKCKDAQGNLSYSTQNCPQTAQTLTKKTIISTEGKYGRNRRDYRDELRESEYQNRYYRSYRYEKPNVFNEISRKKEAEQQQRWDRTGKSREYNRADSSTYSANPYRNYYSR